MKLLVASLHDSILICVFVCNFMAKGLVFQFKILPVEQMQLQKNTIGGQRRQCVALK